MRLTNKGKFWLGIFVSIMIIINYGIYKLVIWGLS